MVDSHRSYAGHACHTRHPLAMNRIADAAALSLLLWLPAVTSAQTPATFQDTRVDVGGYRLQFHIAAGKSPTIVFEAGGGDNSSVWDTTAREVGRRTGARMITYDRAGLGQSDPNPGPSRADHARGEFTCRSPHHGYRG